MINHGICTLFFRQAHMGLASENGDTTAFIAIKSWGQGCDAAPTLKLKHKDHPKPENTRKVWCNFSQIILHNTTSSISESGQTTDSVSKLRYVKTQWRTGNDGSILLTCLNNSQYTPDCSYKNEPIWIPSGYLT